MKYVTKAVLIFTLILTTLSSTVLIAAAADDTTDVDSRGRGIRGEVTAIAENSLTLLARNEESVTVNTDADTVVYLIETGAEGTLSDLTVGGQIRVRGQRNEDGTVNASTIVISPDGDRVGGRVTAVDGTTITVGQRDDNTTTISTDGNTQFRLNNEAASLADVAVDTRLSAYGTLQEDGTLAATLVLIRSGSGNHGGASLHSVLDRDAIRAAIAGALGITVEELEAAKEDGTTIEELAETQGVAIEDVEAAAKAEAIAQVNQAVTDGEITQEQADRLIERINNWDFSASGGHGNGNQDNDADQTGTDANDDDGTTANPDRTEPETASPAGVSITSVIYLPMVASE